MVFYGNPFEGNYPHSFNDLFLRVYEWLSSIPLYTEYSYIITSYSVQEIAKDSLKFQTISYICMLLSLLITPILFCMIYTLLILRYNYSTCSSFIRMFTNSYFGKLILSMIYGKFIDLGLLPLNIRLDCGFRNCNTFFDPY